MQRPLFDFTRPEPLLVPRGSEPGGPAPSPFDIRSLLGLIRRQAKTVLATVIAVLALALLVTSQLERRYTATALLVVDPRSAQLTGVESGGGSLANDAVVDTEVEIARSPAVLARAAGDLDLVDDPEFAPRRSLADRIAAALGLAGSPAPVAGPAAGISDARRSELVEDLSDRLAIGRRPLTNVISVAATARSPALAASLANGVANAYIDQQIDAKVGTSQRAVGFLVERVDRLAADLDLLEARIDAFVTEKLAELGTPEARALLVDIDRQRSDRVGSLTTLNGLRAALQEENYDRLSELLDAGVGNYVRQRAQLNEALAAATAGDGAAAVRGRSSVKALEDEIRAAAAARIAQIQAQIASNDQRAATLRSQLENILGNQELPAQVSAELFRMQRDAEVQRNLYGAYLTKLRQVQQQTALDLPDSRVVSPATPPTESSFPPYLLIGFAAFFVALGAGGGLAFVRERYLGGITTAEQIEAAAGIPAIASIPRFRSARHGYGPDLAIIAEPASSFSESIRRTRLGIEAFADRERFCLYVSSSRPMEGKTTVALSLARAFALTGKKTVLIDADVRRPSVHRYLNRTVDYGLVHYLSAPEGEDVTKVMTVREATTGLHLVLGADGPVSATDVLLISPRFRDLVAHFRETFDIVVIDTSPVEMVVDPQIVARYADIGLFVVRYNKTTEASVRHGVSQLRMSSNRPICAVLTHDERTTSAYGGYGYYRQSGSDGRG